MFRAIILAIAAAAAFISCGGSDGDKDCSVGKPCGDTCIAPGLTCHK